MMNKRFLITIAVLIAIFVGLVIFTKNNESQSNVPPSQHTFGKTDSKVTLVEYGDFQCPACYTFEPTVEQVREKYKDKITFQFRNFPLTQLHPNTLAAHTSAEAASNQGKFWEYHDLLYKEQKSWATAQPADRTTLFEQYAQQIGLNMEQFKTDRVSPAVNDVIQADMKAGKQLGVQGTPTFILNGKKLTDITANIDAFSKLIDEELQKTQSE